MIDVQTRIQFVRYGVVGLASNLVLYLLYLVLTGLGVTSKLAMTLLYVMGTLQSFVFNRRWTFEHQGRRTSSFVRYLAAYISCYFVNLAGLMLCVDQLGWPHQAVQGALILIIAALLFLTQKYWVFSPARPGPAI